LYTLFRTVLVGPLVEVLEDFPVINLVSKFYQKIGRMRKMMLSIRSLASIIVCLTNQRLKEDLATEQQRAGSYSVAQYKGLFEHGNRKAKDITGTDAKLPHGSGSVRSAGA
jgi:hypothetical protein